MADLRPVYLVHGEDDAKIDAWRGRLRRRAEAERGPGGLEHFTAGPDAPDDVAAALATLSFDPGPRYLLVDDAGAWKAPTLGPLTAALAAMPEETTLVLIVRGKPLAALVKAVEKGGGEVREHAAPKPWELPRWAAGRAGDLGLAMDADAARALVAVVGSGQQRIVRELEKIAVAMHPETHVDAEDVERLAAGEGAPKVYDLADAVVARDVETATTLAEELAERDERPSRFVYPIVGRLREVNRVADLLDAGVAEKDLAKELRVPPWRVKKAVALARNADREGLRAAICRFADLEVELRGGGTLGEEASVTRALIDATT